MIYDCIVIGAGTGGLAAALKLSSAGKSVLLIEKQPMAGGFATSFSRKGFIFESSVHCVDALAEEGEVRNYLEEFGVAQKINFIGLKDFARIIYPEHDFVVDFNRDNFVNFLKQNFPQEKKGITRLFGELDKFYKQFDSFTGSKLPTWLQLAISPLAYPDIIRTSCLTIEQFINPYIKDIKLKAIITSIWGFVGLPPARLSALYFLIVFRGYYYNPTTYIRGGFSRLFQTMVEKIEETGSRVRFNTAVEKIISKEEKGLKAVITNEQEEFKARVIISNANAIDTLTGLLDNAVLKEKYAKKLTGYEKSISAFQVYLGLGIPAKTLGMNQAIFLIGTTYNHDDSFRYSHNGEYDRCLLSVVDHAQADPTLVPAGKGSLLIFTLDNYANWQNLKPEEYKAKKIAVANRLISRAEKYLPGLTQCIEVMEIATPRTMARYGTSPEGAIYGFAHTVAQAGINRLAQETAIKGLFLAGGWTRPGAGVHACFISGIEAAKLALKYLK